MISKITQRTILVAILLLTVWGCKKKGTDDVTPVTPTPEPPVTASGVYAVGTSATSINAVYKATMWKDGTATLLSDQSSLANAVAVNKNNIYVVGSAKFGNNTLACYWKNKAIVQLHDGVGYFSEATAVTLSGDDVYIAGFVSKTSTTRVAAYWKNGEMVTLSTVEQNAVANGIATMGDDVYVSGFYTGPNGIVIGCYWKNGVLFPLTNANAASAAFGIIIKGGDIYIAGFVSRTINGNTEPTAFVWRTTGGNMQLQKFGYANQSYANGIAVADGKIHTAGVALTGTTAQAVYWPSSDGVIPMPAAYGSYGNAVAVEGSHVYVAGSSKEFLNSPLYRGAIWKDLEINFLAPAPSEIKGLAVMQ